MSFRPAILTASLLLAGCSLSGEAPREAEQAASLAPPADEAMEGAGGLAKAEKKKPGASRTRRDKAAPVLSEVAAAPPTGGEGEPGTRAEEPAAEEPAAEKGTAPTRAWFPETFLFEPRLVTSAAGEGSLQVPIPHQLTTWRVLGLAHSRTGSQAGTETTFASTLPLYVELVAPPSLRAGDRLLLPLRVVNNQSEPWSGRLSTRVEGPAARGGGTGTLSLSGHESDVRYLQVETLAPGSATVSAALGDRDRVERVLSVEPVGRKLTRAQGGTLAAPRSFELLTPHDALAGASRLELVIYPGPLSLVAQELSTAAGRAGSVEEAAYAYALVGFGRDVARDLGHELDASELREARIRAWQALVPHTRNPDVHRVLPVLAATRKATGDSLARALAHRLAQRLSDVQAADGSFAGAWGDTPATLEQSVVLAARAARLTADLQSRVAQRATGYLSRNVESIRDPHTAAVVMASGALPEPLEAPLLEKILEAVEERRDGSRVVVPGRLSRRPDGSTPETMETTAWAVLALADRPDHEPLVADLGTSLLSAWRPTRAFGDGPTDLVALEALSVLFAEPLPESVQVTLTVDDRPVLDDRLDLTAGFTPLVRETAAPQRAGPHTFAIQADPAVPGLVFSVTAHHWIPWGAADPAEGFTLAVQRPDTVRVGERASVRVAAALPGGEPFTVAVELPAGADPDPDSLEYLKFEGLIENYEIIGDRVVLEGPALPAGAAFDVSFGVIPTLAGRFQWGGSALALASRPQLRVETAPDPWQVRR